MSRNTEGRGAGRWGSGGGRVVERAISHKKKKKKIQICFLSSVDIIVAKQLTAVPLSLARSLTSSKCQYLPLFLLNL